jgi:hypothetical protein
MLNTELTEITQKSQLQLRQESLIRMLDKEYQDRSLFHLVLTYKPYQDIAYDERIVNKFFTTFYTRYFLPNLMKTRNYHRESYRYTQPICIAFIDEHEHSPMTYKSIDFENLSINIRSEYSARLHHHAILAVHHEHLDQMNQLIGTNTLVSNFSYKVMTSFIRPCDSNTLKYASKMMMKYPDFLSFPDRLTNKTN